MSSEITLYLIYLLPLALVLWWHVRHQKRQTADSKSVLDESIASGLTEPPSLHPVIDYNLCIGSGGCAKVCPESALGIVNGKAELVNPTVCIGHGACALACPMQAIKLVFGTERRGMEIPVVNPDFQTNVPGLFIAGELGGMGLIRKAAEQGNRAIASIGKLLKSSRRDGVDFDVVIVGAGPAGLGASLAATEAKLRYVTIEQETTMGGSILHYPRAKVAMTAPLKLPLVGKVKFTEVSKERLIEFWEQIVKTHRLKLKFGERLTGIKRVSGGFEVNTAVASYRTATVLLAIGRRGTPRKLGVEGEDLSKVVYRLIEPEQYRRQHVLVVGGGDSAVEAGLALAEIPDITVTLSYRGDAFGRIKTKNRKRLEEATAARSLSVMLSSQVKRLSEDEVVLSTPNGEAVIKNHAAIVCAGGELPTKLLQSLGVTVATHYGEIGPGAKKAPRAA
jgi:thioredoxin reductase/Pyruvate/2-oxoacid:ferredoxin oxidoreductase delta subunit